jgi:hypothetical protein
MQRQFCNGVGSTAESIGTRPFTNFNAPHNMFNANQYYLYQNKAPSQVPRVYTGSVAGSISPNGNILHPGANFTQVLQLEPKHQCNYSIGSVR